MKKVFANRAVCPGSKEDQEHPEMYQKLLRQQIDRRKITSGLLHPVLPSSAPQQDNLWQLSRSYQGGWSTCPVSKGWGNWSGSAWRRNNIEGPWKQLIPQGIQRGLIGEKLAADVKCWKRGSSDWLKGKFSPCKGSRAIGFVFQARGSDQHPVFQDLTGQSWE